MISADTEALVAWLRTNCSHMKPGGPTRFLVCEEHLAAALRARETQTVEVWLVIQARDAMNPVRSVHGTARSAEDDVRARGGQAKGCYVERWAVQAALAPLTPGGERKETP